MKKSHLQISQNVQKTPKNMMFSKNKSNTTFAKQKKAPKLHVFFQKVWKNTFFVQKLAVPLAKCLEILKIQLFTRVTSI